MVKIATLPGSRRSGRSSCSSLLGVVRWRVAEWFAVASFSFSLRLSLPDDSCAAVRFSDVDDGTNVVREAAAVGARAEVIAVPLPL